MKLTDLTSAQIATICTNYMLTTSDYQTGKVTRCFINILDVMEVYMRVTNSIGKKKTVNMCMAMAGNTGIGDVAPNRLYITGDMGGYLDALELLSEEMLQPVFGTVEEEKQKIADEKAEYAAKHALIAFNHTVAYINKNCERYNNRQMESFVRELKRYGTEKLVTFLPSLNEKAAGVVRTVLLQLEAKQERETILRNPRLIQYTPQLESILNQIEESVKSLELEVYANVLAWLKANESNELRSFEAQAADYIEQQKAKMLYATIRDLQGLDIVEVQSFGVRNHHNGFEGTWILSLADGTIKTYHTHTIIAGGCIQRDHYRYLTNLK